MHLIRVCAVGLAAVAGSSAFVAMRAQQRSEQGRPIGTVATKDNPSF
jgi:hypothetical protein